MSSKKTHIWLVLAVLTALAGWFAYFVKRADAVRYREEVAAVQDRMGGELAALQARLDESERDRESLRAILGQLNGKYATVVGRHTELERQHVSLRDAKESLEGELAATVRERNELDSSLDQARDAKNRVERDLDQMLLVRDRLVDELSLARAAHEELSRQATKDVAERDEALRRSTELLDTLRQRIEAANRDIERTTGELEASRERIRGLEERLAQADTQVAALEERVRQLEAEKRETLARLGDLQERLAREISTRDVQIKQLENNLTLIRVQGDVLFPSGSVDLTDVGMRTLKVVSDAIKQFPDRIVSIEGHSDGLPIGDELREQFPSNWELSVTRASRAARFLIRQGIDPDRVRVVGYGEYRPVASNERYEDRALNRRIEIVLVPATGRRVIDERSAASLH